ncbi:MAG: prepilin peptidase, partial [Gemmatimonadales bacterium]
MWLWMGSLLVVTLSLGAAGFDLRERRIPNWIVMSALVSGLAFRLTLGSGAFVGGLLAVGLAFTFGLVFYLLGGLGAGDVKLMAGLAAFLGLEGLLTGLAVMSAVGVAMALWATWRKGVLGRTFRNLLHFALTLGRASFRGWKGESPMAAALAQDGAEPVRSPYGV